MPTNDIELKDFSVEIDDEGVAIVTVDLVGESVNSVSPRVLDELEHIIGQLESNDAIKAVVFASGKASGFIVGADVKWLDSLGPDDAVAGLFRTAHAAFMRIERLHSGLGKPVVAAIHGPCLGAGMELALACSTRIASNDDATRLGQPEIKLGLIPGAGGTQRLPRLIGLATALDLMLTGRGVRPRTAHEMGMVDEVVPKEVLIDVAIRRAGEAIGQTARTGSPQGLSRLKSWISPKYLQTLALEENPVGRKLLFSKAEEKMLAQTKGNHPAAAALLRVVRVGAEEGMAAGYEAEIDEFTKLVGTPEAKALIGIFLAAQELKRDSGVDGDASPAPVEKVGVLGGGLMGGGIAAVTTVNAGVRSRIKEVDDAAARRGLGQVQRYVDGRVKRRRLSRSQGVATMHLVTATTDWSGLGDVDVVIEAVFEDLDLKREMLARVEGLARDDTIFASNTSSLPISAIAEGAAHPENVIGMHYFSPVEKMPLLEIIVTDATADWVTATCVALGKAQGKTVIVVNDGPGFYTSRVVAPYGVEAGHLLAEGTRIDDIDDAAVEWGFPVGPFQLGDEVGIDVQAKVGRTMTAAFGDRMQPPPLFQAVLDDGRLGRKNGRGFYVYEDGARKGVDETVYAIAGLQASRSVSHDEIQERLGLAFANEAARCLQDGIIRSARDGDIGAVFGLGFPPFRGGPFAWMDQHGVDVIVERLRHLEKRHGDRFTPAAILVAAAEAGRAISG